MALCQCQFIYPRCEYHYCGKRADWSAMVPTWKRTPPLRAPKFFCKTCWEDFKEAWKKPMKGIDRPEGADEYWQPSLLEHIRYAQIAISFEERDSNRVAQMPVRKQDPYWIEIVRRMCGGDEAP